MSRNYHVSDLHILLAEDDALNMKVSQLMLKRLGCSFDMVLNGFGVLQALERQSYDIILMNVCMPQMDGLETTRIIRRRLLNNGPKIIAITANGLPGFREKCLDAGMDDYISKPMTLCGLAEVLKRTASTLS